MLVVLRLTVPVVDEARVNHGWCRLLNSAQCLITPLVCFFLVEPRGNYFSISRYLKNWLKHLSTFISDKLPHSDTFTNLPSAKSLLSHIGNTSETNRGD